MIIPAAEQIEQAVLEVQGLDDAHKASQLQELHEAMGAIHLTTFEDGYLLGIQTARVLVSGLPEAIIHDVSF